MLYRQALKSAQSIFGNDSIDLVEHYIVLAHCMIGIEYHFPLSTMIIPNRNKEVCAG